ncbi:hypothetical protein VP1G_02057 [Cytospora mali]|uniref:Uncharacterized protein n=1 Tax=Cytospora mali TaxID=578113 RepID=A0A194USQ5_CYTMA|nr:hypothetical protein VP1G_02057 [Valsa mali var. pyri (nom. inval.)]
MNEALCSILTGENEWVFHSEGKSVKFNKDGTGELWCCEDGHFWIAMETEWKRLEMSEPSGDETATENARSKGGPRLLGKLELAVTLMKRLPQKLDKQPGARGYVLNERGLTDDAFQPKKYTITIEKGNFVEPCYIGASSSVSRRYALRLLFDISPYPPRSEWKRPEGGPDSGHFWDIKEFVSRESPELKEGRAMNDNAGEDWKFCQIM